MTEVVKANYTGVYQFKDGSKFMNTKENFTPSFSQKKAKQFSKSISYLPMNQNFIAPIHNLEQVILKSINNDVTKPTIKPNMCLWTPTSENTNLIQKRRINSMSHQRIAKNIRIKNEINLYERNMIYKSHLQSAKRTQRDIEMRELQKIQNKKAFDLNDLYNIKFKKFSEDKNQTYKNIFSKEEEPSVPAELSLAEEKMNRQVLEGEKNENSKENQNLINIQVENFNKKKQLKDFVIKENVYPTSNLEEGSGLSLVPYYEKFKIGTAIKALRTEKDFENISRKRQESNTQIRNKIINSHKLKDSNDMHLAADLKSIDDKANLEFVVKKRFKTDKVLQKSKMIEKPNVFNNNKIALDLSVSPIVLEPWGVNSKTFGKTLFFILRFESICSE